MAFVRYDFLRYKHNAELRIGRILVRERKIGQSILQFEDAVNGSLAFMLDERFEFHSPVKKSLLNVMDFGQSFYSVLVGQELDANKSRLKHMVSKSRWAASIMLPPGVS